MVLAERFLHRMQLIAIGQAFNRRHRRAFRHQRQEGAGLHRFAVDMNRARAALGGVAADVRTGQAQMFAQELYQQRAAFDLAGDRLAINSHGNGRHGWLLLAGRLSKTNRRKDDRKRVTGQRRRTA